MQIRKSKNRGMATVLAGYLLEARDFSRVRLHVACLSCELGVKKPQKEIFQICLAKLRLFAEECLYVGDGGSHELDKAKELGMRAVQAAWYLGDGLDQPVRRLHGFEQLESPMDVPSLLSEK